MGIKLCILRLFHLIMTISMLVIWSILETYNRNNDVYKCFCIFGHLHCSQLASIINKNQRTFWVPLKISKYTLDSKYWDLYIYILTFILHIYTYIYLCITYICIYTFIYIYTLLTLNTGIYIYIYIYKHLYMYKCLVCIIVDLKCVSFRFTAKWFIHRSISIYLYIYLQIYIYPFFFWFFSHIGRSLRNIE